MFTRPLGVHHTIGVRPLTPKLSLVGLSFKSKATRSMLDKGENINNYQKRVPDGL